MDDKDHKLMSGLTSVLIVLVKNGTHWRSYRFYLQLQDLGQPPKELAGDAVSFYTTLSVALE